MRGSRGLQSGAFPRSGPLHQKGDARLQPPASPSWVVPSAPITSGRRAARKRPRAGKGAPAMRSGDSRVFLPLVSLSLSARLFHSVCWQQRTETDMLAGELEQSGGGGGRRGWEEGRGKTRDGKIPGDGEEMREETGASLRSRRQREKLGRWGNTKECISLYEGEKKRMNR